MIQLKDKKDCCGCFACSTICPQHCISMEEDNEGFRYPVINKRLCSNCGLCERVCPVINRFSKSEYKPNVFACINRNEEIRKKSSSGGVFSLFAEYTIQNKGVVFGARFDKDFTVIHDFTETIEGLEGFRGSKYVQSLIRECFQKTQQFLKQGREVLFTGTPCQIAGLKHYLGKDYENLLTVDLVCHGVPSPKVFRKYLEELNLLHKGNLEKIKFRDKTLGWEKSSFATKRKIGNNIVTLRQTADKNSYMRGFIQNLYLRPSCHFCPSKAFTSGADITIADYWGIHQIHPEFDDDKGCSLVICNTEQSVKILVNLSKDLDYIESPLLDAVIGNPYIVSSAAPHPRRENFFEQIDSDSIIQSIKLYTKLSFVSSVKKLIHKILISLIKTFDSN